MKYLRLLGAIRTNRRVRSRALLAGLVMLLLWLVFFDSHSLVKRAAWHRHVRALEAENMALKERIEALETDIEAGLSDDVIERIAREQYGMRKPGETVYRVVEE